MLLTCQAETRKIKYTDLGANPAVMERPQVPATKGAGKAGSQFAVFVEKIKVLHQNKLPDLILLVLLKGQAVGPELALLALLAGGAPAWQIRSEGLGRQEIVGLENASLHVLGRRRPLWLH